VNEKFVLKNEVSNLNADKTLISNWYYLNEDRYRITFRDTVGTIHKYLTAEEHL